MKQFLCLGTVLALFLICTGCGDTFRPVIIPNPPTFPNPAAAHTVVTIGDNGDVNKGSAFVIDVTGDANVSIKAAGLHPVHMVQQTANQVLVVNQSDPTVPQDSLTKLNFSGTTITSSNTFTLPLSYDASGKLTTASPNFVATTESTQAYVLLPQYRPQDPNIPPGTVVPSLAVVNTSNGGTPPTVPVSVNSNADPVAIAETPDGKKLYVANQGDGTVAAFNTVSNASPTPRSLTGTFNAPVWVSARNDSQRVYVLNGNGVVSTIDTHLTAGPDSVIDGSITFPGAAYMWYDVILNRLYIPFGTQLAIVSVSQSIPTTLGGGPIAIATVAPSSRLSWDPCAATSAGALKVVAVTSLPDASRVYVGAYYLDGSGNVCPQVTVIDAKSFAVKAATPVPGFPDATNPNTPDFYVPACADPANARFRFTMAAGGDSTRAYLASCDGGNVNIIDTSNVTYIENIPGPSSARAPIPPSTQNPPQSPVFMIAGP